MRRLALRGLRARPARTAFTVLAVVLGTALISGTFLLTDTISKSFDTLLAASGENVDVKVVAKGEAQFDTPASFPEATFAKARAVPGVADGTQAYDSLPVAVLDAAGKRVGPTTGAPTLAFTVKPAAFEFLEYEGTRPRGPGEVAIGRKAADSAGVEVGDTVRIQGNGRIRPFEVTALATFGGSGALGGAGIAAMALQDVQALAGEPDRVTELNLKAEPGVTQAALKSRVAAAVGDDLVTRTGKEDTAKQSQDLGQILDYLTIALLVFGVISLLVGAFVIFNTFTITVAQRRREFGLLRTLGASRKQVLRAVVGEAALIGVLGSLLGLAGGFVLAPGLKGLLGLVGFDLPSQGTVVEPRTVVVALAVGTIVTLVASLAPALRATRVPPIAALQEAALGSAGPRRRWTRVVEAGIAVLGVVIMLVGLLAGLGTSGALTLLGIGALLVFAGIGLLSPLLVAPLAAAIGRPLEAVGGVAGKIARGNAVRSPGRTAGTAAALMVGVALVAFVSIFVNGFKASFSGAFEKAVTADFVVIDDAGQLPEGVADSLRGVPGVATTTNLRVARGKLGSADVSLAGLDPALAARVVDVDWIDGSNERLRALGPQDAMVEEDFAKERNLRPGSVLKLTDRAGRPRPLTVKGIYADRGQLFGDVMAPDATVRDGFGAKAVLAALVADAPGADPDKVKAALASTLKRQYPTLEPQTREEFIDSQVGQVNQILKLFYALLALSVLIALFGIVNTLALSVYERTRELGLLRAVGTSRRQVRRIVRGEAVITAVMGAVLGIVVGVLFGILVSRPLESEGFVLALPYRTLGILVILGAVAGVLAAIAPARRASRIDVLRALQQD